MIPITIQIEAEGYSCGKCHFLKRHQSAMFTETFTCTAFGRQTTRLSKLRDEVQRSGECMHAETKDKP